VNPDERRLSRADLVGIRGWGMILTVLGCLIGVPLWSVFVEGERDHLWFAAVMLLVGLAGAVALWRYLAQPVAPGQEEDLIPALREARLEKERRRQARES
jgi:Na+/melibiose symporter-like transporter